MYLLGVFVLIHLRVRKILRQENGALQSTFTKNLQKNNVKLLFTQLHFSNTLPGHEGGIIWA